MKKIWFKLQIPRPSTPYDGPEPLGSHQADEYEISEPFLGDALESKSKNQVLIFDRQTSPLLFKVPVSPEQDPCGGMLRVVQQAHTEKFVK